MYVGLLLIAVVFFDWLGAIGAATKDGSYSSEYGIRGIIRTTIVLMLPQVGRIMDAIAGQVVVLGVPLSGFYLFISFGLIYNTWMSMTANFSRAGFDKWIPNWMLEAVASEIRAKMTRSDGRREAINGNKGNLPSLNPATPVVPLNESQTTLVNSDMEKEKTNIK
jgi:phage-related holin